MEVRTKFIAPTLLLTLSLSGCAYFLNHDKYVLENAVTTTNPAQSGKAEPSVDQNSRGTLMIESYKNEVLCFAGHEQTSPSMVSARTYYMTTYDTLEGEKLNGKNVKHSRLDITSATQRAVVVHDKEQTTYKDSSGQVIGTAERPVERTEYVPDTNFTVCFPSKGVLTKKSQYLSLRVPAPSLFDSEGQEIVGAWKLANAH